MTTSLSLGNSPSSIALYRPGGAAGTHTLTVGQLASRLGYIAPSTGALVPDTIEGLTVIELTARTGDQFRVVFQGNVQITGIDSLLVSFPGFNNNIPFVLTWDPDGNEYYGTVPGILTYFDTTIGVGNSTAMTVATSPVQLVAITNQSSVVHKGVTWEFFSDESATTSRTAPVALSVLNEPHVIYTVSDPNPLWIKDTAPVSTSINGYIAHGQERKPGLGHATDQGLDESIGQPAGAATVGLTWNAAKNISGVPQLMTKGENDILVKAVRDPTKTSLPAANTIGERACLTVLGKRPLDGFFRPPIAYPDAPLQYKSHATLEPLQNFSFPAIPPIPFADALFYQSKIKEFWTGDGGESKRRLVTDLASVSGYSGDFAARALVLWMINSDEYTPEQKDQLADHVRQEAIDIWGAYLAGWRGGAGAGQWHGYHHWLYYGAALLNNFWMEQAANDTAFISNSFTNISRWIADTDKGSQSAFNGGSGNAFRYYGQYYDVHVGRPHWGQMQDGSDVTARYYWDANLTVSPTELWAAVWLKSLPSGRTGYQAVLLGGPADTTNPRAAAFYTLDRAITIRRPGVGPRSLLFQLPGDGSSTFVNVKTWYEAWRPNVLLPRAALSPEILATMNGNISGPDIFTPGSQSGEVDMDREQAQMDASLTPITAQEARYSFDGKQWFTLSAPSGQHTFTGLMPAADTFWGIREANENGYGGWTANYPASSDPSDTDARNRLTVPGTSNDTDVPVVISDPAVCYRLAPGWGGADPIQTPPGTDFGAASGTLPAGAVVLYLGLGNYDPTKGRPTTWDATLQRNNVDVPGQTTLNFTALNGPLYNVVAADIGQQFRWRLTPKNAAGSGVEVFTPNVIIPAGPVIPPQFLVRTDFGPGSNIYQEPLFNSVIAENVNFIHEPNRVYVEDPNRAGYPLGIQMSPGLIGGNKSGARPALAWNATYARPLIPGRRYRLVLHIPLWNRWLGQDNLYRAPLEVYYRKTETGTDISIGSVNANVTKEYTWEFIYEFTVDLSETELEFWPRLHVDTSTGGQSGGDLLCSFCSLEDLDYVP